MAYTFSAALDTTASGGGVGSSAFNIGAVASPFVIVSMNVQNGIGASSIVTIGGVTLHKDVEDSASQCGIWSGVATGLSGSQTVSINNVGGSVHVEMSVWYTTDSISGVNQSGSQANSSPITLSVNAGDYIFAHAIQTTALSDFNNSTQAPAANHTITGGPDVAITGDWTVASSNASFLVKAETSGSNSNFYGVAATYTPPAASNFITIGIGGSEW